MMAKLTKLTHKIAIQLYHLQFWLQVANPDTFGYTLVLLISVGMCIRIHPSSVLKYTFFSCFY